MQGMDAIKDKIISDAKSEAAEIVAEAKKKAEAIIAVGEKETDEYIRAHVGDKDDMYVSLIQRRRVVTELECRKLRLREKRKALDGVFSAAYDKLKGMSDDRYRKLISAILKMHAEEGDKIIISKNDKAVLKDIGAEATGNFEKGVILSGVNYDKNLTLESELNLLKDELETEIGKLIDKE